MGDRNWCRGWFIWWVTTSLALLHHYICISLSFSICDQLLNFISTVYPVGILPLRTCRLLFFWSCKGVLFCFFPCWKTHILPWIITCSLTCHSSYLWKSTDLPLAAWTRRVKSGGGNWTFYELQSLEIICQGFLRFSLLTFPLSYSEIKMHINERRHIHLW